jgi:hypothetical protein
MGSLFDRIREAAAKVAHRARSVRIDEGKLAEFGLAIRDEVPARPQPSPEAHHLGHGEATLAFVLTLDAISFGSGWFPHLRKRPGLSGYFTVATSLAERFRAEGPWSARQLLALGGEDCSRVFGQEGAPPAIRELMDLFASALRDLGGFLLERFEGNFARLVESADGRAEKLVSLLAEIPFFRDVSRYGGIEVPFYKRAQLTAADLHLAFEGQGWGRFDDIDDLTIFADNLVPHVLRVEGILSYEPDLASRIDAGDLLRSGAPEEVEIRACAVRAVQLLAYQLAALGRPLTEHALDYFLWNRGQEPRFKAIPRHRARSVCY